MSKDRLFVPLNKQWYDLFLSGAKKWEIRGVRPGFNTSTVKIGRRVEIRRGYAIKGALWGTITDILLTRHVYDVPREVMREMIPVPLSDTKTWDEITKYNTKYSEFIVFRIELDMLKKLEDAVNALSPEQQKLFRASVAYNRELLEVLRDHPPKHLRHLHEISDP
jgi:hypothetical protein